MAAGGNKKKKKSNKFKYQLNIENMNRLNHMTTFHDDSINSILTYLQERCYNVKIFSVTEEEAIFSDREMSGI